MTQKLDEARQELANLASEPITWEDTVGGLGLEDFPERAFCLEAGQLLREARKALKEEADAIETDWLDRGSLFERAIVAKLRSLAARIDKLLAEGDL